MMIRFSAVLCSGLAALLLASCASAPAELTPAQKTLISAVRNPGAGDAFRAALAQNPDLNYADDSGMTPLAYAVDLLDTEKAAALLKAGADPVYRRKDNGYTAVHVAAALYDTAPLELLIRYGANLNIPGSFGKTPLMEAARLGNVKAVQALVKAGADLKLKEFQERTVLSFAASAPAHSLDMVKLLLDSGAERAVYDRNGRTPLFHAIVAGNTETALYLLSLLPDFDTPEAAVIGFIAMKHAVFAGNPAVVRQIILKKLPLNREKSLVYKGMEVVSIEGFHELLARNQIIPDGKTPLFWAAEAEQPEIIKLLRKHGADPNVIDNAGYTPIRYARQKATIQALKKK